MTIQSPVEIELKLALPPQQAAAFLKLMARRRSKPEAQDMVTRYFDTPDFALSAQGIALRVRRVGRRWLQTLKTEGERRGGLSRRIEHEMAVSRGSPDWDRFPAEAQAMVSETLRTQLAPVFETRFKRTAWMIGGRGGAEIEVALDVGEVVAGKRSQPICEIELELKAGRPEDLFDLALTWAKKLDCVPFDTSKAERGVRLAHGEEAAPVKAVSPVLNGGMSVEEGFAASVQSCLAQFQANLPGVMASGDIEYVHQARVALRRLRATLRLYRKVCVLPVDLKADLRTLDAVLGPARDWDVLCSETLPVLKPHFPDAADWQRGLEALESRRAEVRAAMRAALEQAKPGAWLLDCQRWLLQQGWRSTPSVDSAPEAQRFIQLSPLSAWAQRALKKGHRPIVRGARDFERLQPAQRHALRIAIKRQRYSAELFESLYSGRRQTRYLAALRDLQDSLGQANDAQVARELMTVAATDAGPMGPFVLGWLAAGQADGATKAIAGQLQNFMKLSPYW